MNIFRLLGDISHLIAIIILLRKIKNSRSVSGISLHTQVLYLIVFLSRYVDLLFRFHSIYNSMMKIFFIGSTAYTVYCIAVKYRNSYKKSDDSISMIYTIVPCILLALLINDGYSIINILWAFSEYLEAIAVFPQLDMIQTTGEADSITSHYLFSLGSYRALYILNWIYRYFVEYHLDWISIVAGTVQTLLYADFFYLYVTKVLKSRKLLLPA